MRLLRKGRDDVNLCILAPIVLWLILAVNVDTTYTGEGKEYKCIALRFMNHAGGNFKVVSTMKPEGYPVTTDEYKLKTIFRHSQLRHFVIFHGTDDEKKREILLDGEKTMSVSPQDDCEHFADVIVTARDAPADKEPQFSETNLPTDLKKASTENLGIKKTARQQIEEGSKKGKTHLDKNLRHTDETKHNGQRTTFSDNYTNFITKTPLTKPAKKSTSNSYQLSLLGNNNPEKNHHFTKSYEDDTNITYVDEDTVGNEPMLSYHPLESEKSMRQMTNTENSHGKSEYDEEVKILKKMFPLLAKYGSKIEKNDKGQQLLGSKKIPRGSKNSTNSPDVILNKQTAIGLATPKQSKLSFRVSMKNGNILKKQPNVSQTTLHHTKLTNKDGTLEILNKLPANGSSIIGRPKVIHSKAEAIGEIFKALGGNNRIVKDANGLYLISGEHVKIIHRTHGIQAWGKNFDESKHKETESSRKTSEEIKPSHKQGETEDKIGIKNSLAKLVRSGRLQLPNKEVHREELFQIPEKSEKDLAESKWLGILPTKSQNNPAPAVLVNSPNSGKTPQGLSTDVLDNMRKKFGPDLSLFNLKDFQYKIQSNSKNPNFNKHNKTTEGYESDGIHLRKNGGSNEVNMPNDRLYPPNKKAIPFTNLKSRNGHQTQWKLDGNSYTNSTVPHNANNMVLPRNSAEEIQNKKGDEIRMNDAYINSTVPIQVNTNSRSPDESEMDDGNEDRNGNDTFNDDYSNSTRPLNVAGKPMTEDEDLSKASETQASNPLNFTTKHTDNISNESDVFLQSQNRSLSNEIRSASKPSLERFLYNTGISQPKHESPPEDTSSYSVDNGFQHKSSATNETLRDVHIEVIDEAKGEANADQTSTDIKQDSENVEIIDEGASSEPPVRITPQDISSALHDTFGKDIDSVHSWPWKTRKETKFPDITKASKSHQSILKTNGVGLDDNLKSKNRDTFAESGEENANDERKLKTSSDATLPEITKLATGNNKLNSTSGLTWSVRVVGDVGRPQEETLGKTYRSESRKVTTELSNSVQDTQSDTENVLGGNTGGSQSTLRVNGHHLGTSEQKIDSHDVNGNANVEQSNNDDPVGINRGKSGSQRTSMSNQGEQGANVVSNGSDEPMIPKRIVDALLLSLTRKSKEGDSENNQMNGQKLPKKAPENNMITKVDNRKPIDSQQDNGPSQIKPASLENANLDNLLEKFVRLLSRHMKRTNTEKPKTNVKTHHKHTTVSKTPSLRAREELLWNEQRKLEQQLRAEEELLKKSKLKESLENSPTNVEVQIKDKIRELNEEENFLLDKLRMLSFQEKHETKTGDLNNKLTIRNLETDLTEVRDEPNQKIGIAPYMDSHVTYNAMNDRDFNKKHGTDSERQHADEKLNHMLAEYEAMTRSSDETANAAEQHDRTPNNPKAHTSATRVSGEHEFQQPYTAMELGEPLMVNRKHDMLGREKLFGGPKLNSNTHVSNKVTSNIRDFDNMPRYTADQMPDEKSFTAGASEHAQHISAEHPTHQHTSEYIRMDPHGTHGVPYLHTSNHIPSTHSYPTPSFINKEADYASDAAEKFENPFMLRKSHDDRTIETLDQRSIKKKSDYNSYMESPNRVGNGRQRIQGVNNVFPGTFSYDEGHESTQEDANLLKEMPEYSEKDNTVESETQPGHYTVRTTDKDSDADVKPPDTNTADSDGEIKQLITNTAGSDRDDDKIGLQELRTGTEASRQPAESQQAVQSSDTLGLERNGERNYMLNAGEMNQRNSPQTTDIASSDNKGGRVPGNELENSFGEDRNRFGYENLESHKSEMNEAGDLHNNIQAGRFSALTSRQESDQLISHVTSTADSENDDENEEGARGPVGDSGRPTEPDIDGAFEVVQDGEVPTLRRDTDNPEDGVRDQTFINGDEYHLQKKHGIAKNNNMKHKSSVKNHIHNS